MATDGGGPVTASWVIYLGADADLAEGLRPYLTGEGVELASCVSAADAAAALRGARAGLLLVDARGTVGLDAPARDLAATLQDLSADEQRPKWACIADAGNLAARLVALRGGALACYSNLPSAAEFAARLLNLLGANQTNPYRVLVVDDQHIEAMLVAGILNRAGMVVRTVFDPLTVLDVLDEFRPDLILMDMHMPGADGIELTSIIRAHDEFFALPVIFVSVGGDRDRQVAALQVGADGLLSKPVEPDLLVDTVRRRIELARSMRDRHNSAALRDPETGIWGRGYLLQRIDRAILDGAAKDPGQGVIYIHIGPTAGWDALRRAGGLDDVLAHVTRAVRDATGPSDIAARLGERSLALLVCRPDARQLEACAEGLRGAIAGTALDRLVVKLTVSIGIGLFQPPADDAITMISRGKTACAKARQAGSDRVATYVPTLPAGSGASRSARLAELIRGALRTDGFHLLYQPVVPVQQRKGERYAALLRMLTPEGELIPPFEFLPAAAQFGLTPAIDRWVMSHALDAILQRRVLQPGLVLMLRQTLATAGDPDWVIWLRDEIGRRDLIRHRPALIFDLEDVQANREVATFCFDALKRLGIEICLNRMDETRASLDTLGRFPWSTVRLRQEVLTDLDAAGLSTLVAAVHRLGAQAIATCVEDPQAIAKVWGCGVDFVEGNFIQAANEALDFDFAMTEMI
jgi:PleD family two-component response regulator/EAL domain-containing protein (putative c-di-GMP-specific phosphodiesterase class I)